MSIFNFRRGRPANVKGKASATTSKAAESVEVVRKRARQRLIGSAVLVLIGVVGFPLLFETQPRAVPVDIAIEIPSRNAVKPGSPVSPVVRNEPVVEPAAEPAAEPPKTDASPTTAPFSAPSVSAQASLIDKEEIVDAKPSPPVKVDAKPETKAEAKPKLEAKPKIEPRPESKPEAKPESKPEAKPEAKPKVDDGQRARALLDGSNPPPASSTDKRVVVQVGAFSDETLAREARAKLERAGLKTYTQVAETKDGKRIRVRVGPFANRADAEKAASKIKTLNLPAAVLEL
jgi:DedD protein